MDDSHEQNASDWRLAKLGGFVFLHNDYNIKPTMQRKILFLSENIRNVRRLLRNKTLASIWLMSQSW